MKTKKKTISFILYAVLFLGAAWVSVMGYREVAAARSEETPDLATWLPKQQINQLMRFHGADILKVTRDEVFIHRDSKWVLVMRRDMD